jgi:hypothetical protein
VPAHLARSFIELLVNSLSSFLVAGGVWPPAASLLAKEVNVVVCPAIGLAFGGTITAEDMGPEIVDAVAEIERRRLAHRAVADSPS